jgi:hypothetical protein
MAWNAPAVADSKALPLVFNNEWTGLADLALKTDRELWCCLPDASWAMMKLYPKSAVWLRPVFGALYGRFNQIFALFLALNSLVLLFKWCL